MELSVTREPAQQKLRTSLTRISSTTANDHASRLTHTHAILIEYPVERKSTVERSHPIR
jgi:hypothetical protein